nr:MAG TPA: hypothetical protein [Caudoviricetes sp.]
MTKLEKLDELRDEYFKKFDDIFPLWGMSIDKAIGIIKKCIAEGKPYKDKTPDDVYT